MGKSKRDYHNLGAEENTDKEVKRINKKKKLSVDSEVDEISSYSTRDGKKKIKEKKNKKDPEVDENDLKCMKNAKKEKKKKKKKKKKKRKRQREDSEVEENNLKCMKDAKKEKKKKKKRQREDSEAEENNLNSTKYAKKKRKKKRHSEHSEAQENSLNSTEDAKKKRKKKRKSEDPEAEENNLNSTKDAKKKKRQSEHSEAEENNLNSTEDAKKKKKKKRQSEHPEAKENNLNSKKDAKIKRKKKRQSEHSEAEENSLNSTEDAKKKIRKKKRHSEDSEAAENNLNSTEEAHMEREKKQKCGKIDKGVTTSSSKSTKKVMFSDQVEIFPADNEESKEEEGKLVRGKRFTEEEDELIKNAVLEYVDDHALGDEGVKMVMKCRLHPQLKGCWKEIASALPWRSYNGVYNRGHIIFEAGSKGTWTKEDKELVLEYQKQHGNDWRTLADVMGKSRIHVKDAWRRMRLGSWNKGYWMREEYQNLFDLVNKEIKMKVFQEKHSKHGMLRDNIPWTAVSHQLESRNDKDCCQKWYNQLISPLVAKGIWANVDDYKLLDELLKLDAACIDDVDWDNLLDNRNGETCRKRWDQMVKHIGSLESQTFAEQVEILSDRYCPDLAEDRENFDNRPYDR